MSQEEAAKSVGKSGPAVANALRLLKLPKPLYYWLRMAACLPAMLGADSPALRRMQKEAAQKIMEQQLSDSPDGGTDQTMMKPQERTWSLRAF